MSRINSVAGLVPWREHARAQHPDRAPLFQSEDSMWWFIRHHKPELVRAGALVWGGRGRECAAYTGGAQTPSESREHIPPGPSFVGAGVAAAAFAGASAAATPGPAAFQGSDVMNTSPQPRTVAVAMSEIRYAMQFGSLNETFWRHVDGAFNLVQAVAGALAFAGFVQGSEWAGLAAFVTALVAGAQLVWKPAEHAYQFREARMAFADLLARGWGMELAEVDAALERQRAAAPRGFRWLARPAQNDTVRTLGSPELVQPLHFGEALFAAIA